MHPSLSTALRPASGRTMPRRVEPLARSAGKTCFVLEDALDAGECASLVAELEARGFGPSDTAYPPSYRDNERLVADDPALAEKLLARLAPSVPAVDGFTLAGLNPRFRACRYRAGQTFRIHRDGVFHAADGVASRLSCVLYLNAPPAFTGGDTRFFAGRTTATPALGRITPRAGSIAVFDHTLWHDGDTVTAGTKYVLRSDLLFRGPPRRAGGHDGYVYSVCALAGGGLASGGRDRTIRLWRRAEPSFEPAGVLEGHGASIAAIVERVPGELWSASRDGTVRTWGPRGERRVIEAHAGAALSLAVLRDGRVASGGADGVIRIWSPTGALTETLRGHAGWVWALAVTAAGRLASASEDGTVRTWGPDEVAMSRGVPVTSLACGPGGLVAGCADGTITAARDGHGGAVRALAFLPGGRLASAGEDDVVRVHDLAAGTSRVVRTHTDFVFGLAVLDGDRLASASYDGHVELTPV